MGGALGRPRRRGRVRRTLMSSLVVFMAWAVLVGVAPAAPPMSAEEAAAQSLMDELRDALAQIGPAPAAAQSNCSGEELASKDAAEDSYETLCGETYDPNSGFHSCAWVTTGWVCSGPGTGGTGGNGGGEGTVDPPDPTVGGPTGNGPLLPTDLTAVPVIGDTEAVNPDGIRVSWNAGGGPESLGFNINRRDVDSGQQLEYLISIIGRTWFVDCEVEAGRSYEYTVSAWSDGPIFSFTTLPQLATAAGTPAECRSLVPPGPSGDNEPSTDPLFTNNPRDLNAKPATPQDVRIVGSGAEARLRWEMPASARMVYQITRNGLTENVSDELWGQFQVTPGHQDMTFGDRGDGGAWMSFPVGQFAPGDNFVLQATHPWSIADDELGENVRFSMSSRFATIINPGGGNTIPSFYDVLDTAAEPEGAWIGSRADWSPIPQFTDNFNGSGKLADSTDQWYFARNDGPREITPSWSREQTQTDERAVLNGGRLEMSAGIADDAYSYIGTANDAGDGYLIDPTNGVFVEASVRLDHMSPADNAWWAFWLMAPGSSGCDANGDPVVGGSNAYDGHTETGVELDLFEFVPDLNNGFNQALFRYENGQGEGCTSPGVTKLAPDNRNFTYEGVVSLPGVDMPNYMDGNYHRLGLYYAQDCYAIYLDGEMMWQITEESHPGWITARAREAIRLTWEIQNDPNPWTQRGGSFSQTALDRDPTVYIDYVNVWEKNESANGLCSGGVDPEREPDPEPLADLVAPVNLVGDPTPGTIAVTWDAGNERVPDGYDIRRNGEGYWTVTDGSTFDDTQVESGQSYTYAVVPWVEGADGAPESRIYGPPSADLTVTAAEVLEPVSTPTGFSGEVTAEGVRLSWGASTGPVFRYQIFRDRVLLTDTVDLEYVDDSAQPGVSYDYRVRAITVRRGPQNIRSFSAWTPIVSVEMTTVGVALPTNITAVIEGAGVRVTWTPATGDVAGYRLFRNGAVARTMVGGDRTTVVDLGPALGENSYTMRAFELDDAGARVWSVFTSPIFITVTTELEPVTVPTNVLTALVPDGVRLSWGESTGPVDRYQIFRDRRHLAYSTGTSHVDASAVAGTTYEYRVRALTVRRGPLNIRSASPWSPIQTVLMETVAGVSRPTGVTAVVSGPLVTVSWTAVADDITGYRVYRDGVVVRTIVDGRTSIVDTGPAAGSNAYTVRAFSTAADGSRVWSIYSDPVFVTVTDVLEPVTVPTDVAAVLDGTSVQLSWQPSTGPVEAYQVFRDGRRLRNVTGLSFVDDEPVPGETHEYQVRAFTALRGTLNIRSFSPRSLAISIEIPAAPEQEGEFGPEAIEELTFRIIGTSLELRWEEPFANVDGYLIFRDNAFHDHKDAVNLTRYEPTITEIPDESAFLDRTILGWSDFATNGATAPHVYGVQPFITRGDGTRLLGTMTSIYTTPDVSGGSDEIPAVDALRLETVAFEATAAGGMQFSFGPPEGVEITGYVVEENGVETLEVPVDDVVEFGEDGRVLLTIPNPGLRPTPGRRDFAIRAYSEDAEGLRTLSFRRTVSTHVAGNGFVTLFDTPILAPVEDLLAVQTRFKPEVVLKWKPQEYSTLDALDIERPSGYNIERNGEFVTSVSSAPFVDENVVAGQQYWYRVVPYFTSVNGDVQIGPPAATQALNIKSVPSVINPDAPVGLSARQLDALGQRIEISWLAPEGWEQGLIESYQVMRNGIPYGEPILEPTFGPNQFPYATRTFIDEAALLNVPTSYTVVAFSTEGTSSEGSRSDVALITPVVITTTSEFFNPELAPQDADVPTNYTRAAEVVFNVSGNEARRLGAEFFALHDYLNRGVWNTNSQSLLRSFNNSALERNFAGALNETDATLASAESAQELLVAIATQSGGPNGHLMAIIPELFKPSGYDGFVYLGGWRNPQNMTEEEQLEQIRLELENLQGALDYVDSDSNSETAWKRTRNAAQLIIWNTFNVRNGRGGERPNYSHDRWYGAVRSGVVPPCIFCTQYGGVTAELFYEATTQDRLDFYDVDPNAWEFVQPYIDLALMAQENVSNLRSARYRSYLAAVITIVVAVITAGKGLTWQSLVFQAFGAYASTLVATGSTAQAEKSAFRSLASGGAQVIGADLSAKLAQGLALPGVDIATAALLEALVVYVEDKDTEAALQAFTATVVDYYGTEYFGRETWAKLEPFVEVAENIVWSAVLNEDIDFDDIGEQLKGVILDAIGDEVSELVGDALPTSWSPFAGPLQDLARQSILVSGDEAEIRSYFFNTTLPALAAVVGSKVTERLGKENLYARVAGELVEIGITYGTESYDSKAFERLLYGVVGDLVREGINDKLGSLNTSGDPVAAWVIDGFAELAYIGIAFAYDPNQRDAALEQFKLEQLTGILLAVMPGCVDTNNGAVQDVAQGLVEAAVSQDLDENDITDLVINGVWAGQSIAETCGAPPEGQEAPEPQEDLLDFRQRVLDLLPFEIQMTDLADGDELMLSPYPAYKVKLTTGPPTISGRMADIYERTDVNAEWTVTEYRVLAIEDATGRVEDFEQAPITCSVNQPVALLLGSGRGFAGTAGGGVASIGSFGMLAPTPLLAARFGCDEISGPVVSWLLSLSEAQINNGTDIVWAERPDTSGRTTGNVMSGTTSQFPDFRLDVVGTDRVIVMWESGGSIRFTAVDLLGTVRNGAGEISKFFPKPQSNENFKDMLLRLTPAEIVVQLEFSTITLKGETFDVIESPLIPDQRLRLSGASAEGEIGTIEIGRGVERQAVADLVTVQRVNGEVVGFEHLPDTSLEDMAGPMGRLMLSLLPGIPTSSEGWEGLWRQLVGCGTAIKQFFQGLWQVVANPIDTLIALIKAIPGIIELFAYSPRLLGEKFLKDLIRADDYAALQAIEPGSLAEQEWMGRLKCDVLLAFAGGTVIRFVSKAAVNKVVGDVNNNKFPDLVGGCPDIDNSFPAGTLVLMADGSLALIEDIEPGDRVRTYNERSRRWGDNEVLAQWSAIHHEPMVTVTLTDGSEVTSTDDHLYWVDSQGRWVEADELQPGDFLLTPDGVTQIADTYVHDAVPVEVWELDTAIDDTFTVMAGANALLVHNAPRCFNAPTNLYNFNSETFLRLMPNRQVPGNGSGRFAVWWDDLTLRELEYLIQDKSAGSIYDTIKSRIRNGGGEHEWCMCSEMLTFKSWGVSMDDIQDFTSKTDDVHGTLPAQTASDLGLPPRPGGAQYVWGHSSTDYDGDAVSTFFHQDLRLVIQSSQNEHDFVLLLQAEDGLLARYGINPDVLDPPDDW